MASADGVEKLEDAIVRSAEQVEGRVVHRLSIVARGSVERPRSADLDRQFLRGLDELGRILLVAVTA